MSKKQRSSKITWYIWKIKTNKTSKSKIYSGNWSIKDRLNGRLNTAEGMILRLEERYKNINQNAAQEKNWKCDRN